MTMILPQPMERFLTEVKREFGADGAQALREAFEATEIDADDCFHHQQFSQAIALTCAQPRPLHERLDAIFQIVEMPKGYITVSLPKP
jgi:hypothetical protein